MHHKQVLPRFSISSQIPQSSNLETGRGFAHSWSSRFVFASLLSRWVLNMAHAAAVAVSKSPGSSYNPLFYTAPLVVVKTHLMHAMTAIIALSLCRRQWLIAGEDLPARLFGNSKTDALLSFEAPGFHEILMIDDVQFIQVNTVQEEFSHL